MKLEDVKVGMKVVPFKKTAGYTGLKNSAAWEKANNKKQPFLYVIKIMDDGEILLNDFSKNYNGDFFKPEDFVLYKEDSLLVETFVMESLPFLINFKITDKNNNITYQTVDTSHVKYKIIINGTTTIAILNDGSKGIAKCLPEDKYDRDKGIDIAYKKALIKSYQRELNELIK